MNQEVVSYLKSSTEQQILKDKLELTLQAEGFNIARAAKALGVTRRTVYLRLGRFGLPRLKGTWRKK